MMPACGPACAEWAGERRRFGYRRLHILLRRDGLTLNYKTTRRLYRDEGLTVRRRKSGRRALGVRAPAPAPVLPNQRWSLDFVHDQLMAKRRFHILNVAHDVTRECLRAVLDTSISDRRVVRERTELISERGAPKTIVSDQRESGNGPGIIPPRGGTELTSNAVLAWSGQAGVD